MSNNTPTPRSEAEFVRMDMEDLSIGHKLQEIKDFARTLERELEEAKLDSFKAGARWAAGRCKVLDDIPHNDFERGENSGMLHCETTILSATNNLTKIPE